MRVRLSGAQEGALYCMGLDATFDETDALLVRCWSAGAMTFEEADRDALYSAVNDLSNLEDSNAEDFRAMDEREMATHTARAARALGTLAGKILRA